MAKSVHMSKRHDELSPTNTQIRTHAAVLTAAHLFVFLRCLLLDEYASRLAGGSLKALEDLDIESRCSVKGRIVADSFSKYK